MFLRIDSSIPADQRPPIVEKNGGTSTTDALDLIKIGLTVEVRIVNFCNILIKR